MLWKELIVVILFKILWKQRKIFIIVVKVFYFKNKHSESVRVEVLFSEGYLKFCNFKNRLRFNVHKFIQTKFTIQKYSSVQGFHLLMWTSIGSYQCKYQLQNINWSDTGLILFRLDCLFLVSRVIYFLDLNSVDTYISGLICEP